MHIVCQSDGGTFCFKTSKFIVSKILKTKRTWKRPKVQEEGLFGDGLQLMVAVGGRHRHMHMHMWQTMHRSCMQHLNSSEIKYLGS